MSATLAEFWWAMDQVGLFAWIFAAFWAGRLALQRLARKPYPSSQGRREWTQQ